MRYQKIAEAEFLDRPNRFIAHVKLNGAVETVHVKNTGRCAELLLPGAKVILEDCDKPGRKTRYDLIGVYKEGLGLVNMDSQAPNQVVGEYLAAQEEITYIKPEYRYGDSRVDFYFERAGRKCLMEVKGVTLEREGIAYFPDAPTERGVKHIRELQKALAEGYESYIVFVVQMPGITLVRPNDDTHPAFGEALREAAAQGVRVLALECEMEPDALWGRRMVENPV